ncbi:MAG: NAD-binding protein, partial [Gemmatimonadota bacterium]|nr:NAD-binding protein [Gemmatimonadota bacterium]
PYLILTLSPEGALHAEAAERHVLRGNYTRQHELDMAGARRARLLVVADDDLETTRRVVAAARATRPDLRILVRTRYASEIEELEEAGAAEVVTEERESVARLLAEVLETYGVDADTVASYERAVRAGDPADGASGATGGAAADDADPPVSLTARQRATEACSHVDRARAVRPSAEGCEECLKTGDEWVHLRICMTCGKVGCCDASPNKHASEHARAADHPIVRSFEPRETWAWCFEDETYLG